VLACALGSPYVYASVEEGEDTAPGQVPVALLAGIYRVRELGGGSALFGLLGNPALSSLGPWLHNRMFRRLGIDAVYLPFETSRPEAVVAMLPRRQLRGLSVTAPWKRNAVALCHRLTEEAAATGVVNTVVAEAHGLLVGHNTDVIGVRVALERAGVALGGGRPAVVLGTGGAARGGAYALAQMGFRVTMLGRSLEPARDFAKKHGIPLGSLTVRTVADMAPAVLVNATPVGSLGCDPEERLLPGWTPTTSTVVLDMVYQPFLTRLLRDAKEAGAQVVPGVEMFVGQAQAQVKLFTGATVDDGTLRTLLAGTAVSSQ
jgi:3-dehydroquinate dehydratase/shikimate dehydrogenase